MKMEVSSQQHQSSTESLQSSLRRQEGRTRSLQEDLAAVRETLRARDEEFESYKVRIVLCVTEFYCPVVLLLFGTTSSITCKDPNTQKKVVWIHVYLITLVYL